MIDRFLEVMAEIGKPLDVFESPDGSRMLVLPHGGRVLGLFAPGDEENFFWVNEALADGAAARALIEGDAWQNLGGDRTWLAPELDFFYPDYPDLSSYAPPRAFDPGHYQLTRSGAAIELSNVLTLRSNRLRETFRLKLIKKLTSAPSPLRYEKIGADSAGLRYAGYTLKTSLEIVDGPAGSRQGIGIWNLLQMPEGGELLIPTCVQTEPRLYFGTIVPEELVVEPHLIRLRMRSPGVQKFGVRATALTGRAGYLLRAGSQWTLIVRNFSVNPSGDYVDTPAADRNNLIDCLQVCHVNGSLGVFNELEYHAPAISLQHGQAQSLDISQVWAFRGDAEAIHAVCQTLLSSELRALN